MKEEKNCLNCFYEPHWGKLLGVFENKRQIGKCKFKAELPILPSIYIIVIKPITKYSDDSGVITQCKAWKSKREGNGKS